MGAQHVAGQNDGVFLPQQMLEHVLGKKYGEIFPRHVLGVLSRTENRDFGLRQNTEMPGQAGHDGLESVKDESIGLTAGGRAVWSPKGIAVHGI